MEKFDIALSIGMNCKPAFYLKYLGLRTFASPMDWQVCSIKNQIELYKSHFEGFFDKYIEDESIKEEPNFRAVRDTKYDILSMHHVDKDLPLDKGVEKFRKIMKKRYERLNHRLSEAKSILLVSDEQVPFSDLKKYIIEFSKIYPNKKIKLINIENIDDGFSKEEYNIGENLFIIKYFFNDTFNIKDGIDVKSSNFNWIGNIEKWIQVMSGYGLNK